MGCGEAVKGRHPAGLLASHRLPVFCLLILKIGNFLNYVSGQHAARPCSLIPTWPRAQAERLTSRPRRAATPGTRTASR